MATAFAATATLPVHVTGVKEKKGRFSLQLPSSWLAAGIAWDLSAGFTAVTKIDFGTSGAVTDHGYRFSATGTVHSSGDGHQASTILIQAHWSTDTATGAVLLSVTDTTDLSAINDLMATVYGW